MLFFALFAMILTFANATEECDGCGSKWQCNKDGKYLYTYFNPEEIEFSQHIPRNRVDYMDSTGTFVSATGNYPLFTGTYAVFTSQGDGCAASPDLLSRFPRLAFVPSVPSVVECNGCESNKHLCKDGKYLFTFKGDNTVGQHNVTTSLIWQTAGFTEEKWPVYTTTIENGCYHGDTLWPRLQVNTVQLKMNSMILTSVLENMKNVKDNNKKLHCLLTERKKDCKALTGCRWNMKRKRCLWREDDEPDKTNTIINQLITDNPMLSGMINQLRLATPTDYAPYCLQSWYKTTQEICDADWFLHMRIQRSCTTEESRTIHELLSNPLYCQSKAQHL
jgi:hypothetical protein